MYCYVDKARPKEDFSDVVAVGIDKASRKIGHEYVMLVANIKDSKIILLLKEKTLRLLSVSAEIFKIMMKL